MLAALALIPLSLLLIRCGRQRGDPSVYALGNWAAPFGIVLMLDRLAALMLLATALPRQRRADPRAAWRRPPGQAFPRVVPVPFARYQRRLPDRRPVQPVRVLRDTPDRLPTRCSCMAAARSGCARACTT
ncbi:hypothetical protein ACPA9J_12270 [Pseudomonas aeruginosa]